MWLDDDKFNLLVSLKDFEALSYQKTHSFMLWFFNNKRKN